MTLPPYEAHPDDGKDDTAALQRAITENVSTGRVLYLPAGRYDISSPLVAKNADGLWRCHLTLQGQGRDKTILRLADSATEFGDASNPRAVITTGSQWEKGDAKNGGGNKAFRNNLFDLTIETGNGNPGAIGIEWAVSNAGAIQNVAIRSNDTQGVAGIAMLRNIPGPGLIKNVCVTGFDTGIDAGDIQYGFTLENVTVQNQHVAGIRVSKNLLHIRKLKSINCVPALLVTSREGTVTLIDSQLTGGDSNLAAIDCEGNLLLRNVSTEGYRKDALRWRGTGIPQQSFSEWNSPQLAMSKNAAPSGPLLPVEETPEYFNGNLSDWVAVGVRELGEADDTRAIQRAIDSGKGTVYFKNDRVYFLSGTVIIRGAVRQVLGMGAEISLGAASEPFGDKENPLPLIRIDPTEHPYIFFENLFFNAQYPGEILFENNSPATVIISHCAGWVGGGGYRRSYRNTARGTGKLFLEDVFLPGWNFRRQQVWARQFNPENWDGDGIVPQVANRGGQLWILGFKTEGPAPFLLTSDGGCTELLGGYNYISATKADPAPPDSVPYVSENSQISLTFVSENFRYTDYRTYIRSLNGGLLSTFSGNDLPPRNGNPGDRSFAVPLFRNAPPDQLIGRATESN